MVAKKMPPRKMVAPKPATRKAPVKKAVAKKTASAADFRKKEEADKKKMAASKPKAKAEPVISRSSYANDFGKGTQKALMDARGRASKYGKPKYETIGGGSGGKNNSTFAQTLVTSKRGNEYVVYEDKTQRRLRPDSKPKTSISQYGTTRNPGQRDAKFGPAPKAPKRKGK